MTTSQAMEFADQGCEGTVTSFNFGSNGQAGYGFITSDQVEGDVYFKRVDLPEDLQNFGYNNVVKGRSVTFDLVYTPEGKPQGVNVKLVPQPGEPIVGKIRSYSQKNGYGFIESTHSAEAIYFQKKELPLSVQQLDGHRLLGQTVQCHIVHKPDGKPWGKDVKLHKMIMPSKTKGDNTSFEELVIAKASEMLVSMNMGADASALKSLLGKRPVSPTSTAGLTKKAKVTPTTKVAPSKAKGGGKGVRKSGIVKTYNAKNGWGFLGCDEVPQGDVYFKRASLAQGSPMDIKIGRKLSFMLIFTEEGRPQGTDIILK